jgi:hypothetical protein
MKAIITLIVVAVVGGGAYLLWPESDQPPGQQASPHALVH